MQIVRVVSDNNQVPRPRFEWNVGSEILTIVRLFGYNDQCVEVLWCNNAERDARIILKMISHKYWNQLLNLQWSRHCRSHSVVLDFPSRRPTKRCGKLATGLGPRPTRKYDIGQSLLGDGVANRIKAGTHLYSNWIPWRCPAAVFRERVRKLGMDVWMSTRSRDRPPFVFVIYYL